MPITIQVKSYSEKYVLKDSLEAYIKTKEKDILWLKETHPEVPNLIEGEEDDLKIAQNLLSRLDK